MYVVGHFDVIAIGPRTPLELRKRYAKASIERFAGVILNVLANRSQILTLYTVTAIKEGDELVRGAGFHLMDGKSHVSDRTAYELQRDESGLAALKRNGKRG